MSLQKEEKRKLRIKYGIAFIILFGIEVLIALFVHDTFIRPYIGDVLVIIVLYCAVRVVIPDKCAQMPIYLFIFAAGVECLQYLQLVKLLGLENNTFMRILIGSTFDLKDIACYAAGCIILGIFECWMRKKLKLESSINK